MKTFRAIVVFAALCVLTACAGVAATPTDDAPITVLAIQVCGSLMTVVIVHPDGTSTPVSRSDVETNQALIPAVQAAAAQAKHTYTLDITNDTCPST